MIYRRDTHVVELQIGNLTSRLEDACAPDQFDPARTPYTTLLGESFENFKLQFLLIKNFFILTAAASTTESIVCPLAGSYSVMGPLGPPYMMSRHKRNGTKQHHHIAAAYKSQHHDVLSFRNGDVNLHNLHDRMTSQRHRRDLSKCLSAHKQKRRLSIGCSRDDTVEVHPQCSETGDEGKEINLQCGTCGHFCKFYREQGGKVFALSSKEV